MFKEIRWDYEKNVKKDKYRNYSTIATCSMNNLEFIEVIEKETKTRFVLDKHDITTACLDFIEKRFK